ncbi:uncharacterized protein RJT20DRAFT_885 [Scheffersomyces xylosifermentans]|uniref:uncharacterized protein n=1 Tax=Scheffersomyces xylosifermentans TaxID=1304137 RepID=UPI00315DFDBB
MSDESVNQILNGDIDLYEFLEVGTSASVSEIRRQYRKKALIHHPDKEGGDAHTFDLLLKAYEILVNEDLKRKYDKIRSIKNQRQANRDQLANLTRQFQEELEKSEKQYQDEVNFVNKRKWQNDLEQLKEDGLSRRRKLEQSIIDKKPKEDSAGRRKYISFNEIPIERYFSFNDLDSSPSNAAQKLKVKWKHKQELEGHITKDVVKQIMEIFGKITYVKLLHSTERNPRYNYALIEYEDSMGSEKALKHNYRDSAKIWDGTNVRKLASLLRGCTRLDSSEAVRSSSSFESIKNHPHLPKDMKIRSTTNEDVNEVLFAHTLETLNRM